MKFREATPKKTFYVNQSGFDRNNGIWIQLRYHQRISNRLKISKFRTRNFEISEFEISKFRDFDMS